MLVNCVVYHEGRKLADIRIDQISDYLTDAGNFVWVGLKDPGDDELEAMRYEFALHELAVEDARKGHQRSKLEEYGDSIFVVLPTVEISDEEGLKLGEVDVFVGANYVLSVRHRSEQGFSSVRERCEREPHLLRHGAAFVLYALMDTVVDRYFPVVDRLECELESIEESIFSKSAQASSNIAGLYGLKRKLTAFQHATSSMAEATSKLHGGRVPRVFQDMQEYFRDVSDHVIRVSKSVEGLREMTAAAVHVNLSMISLGESEVTKKLASYGALFAVPTAIAGIYGMNFKFMPELEWPYSYPLVVFCMMVVDLILWRQFRKARWL